MSSHFLGTALMALGGLVVALCGTCTAGLIATSVMDAIRHGYSLLELVGPSSVVLAIGGVPVIVGVLIAMAGGRMIRRR